MFRFASWPIFLILGLLVAPSPLFAGAVTLLCPAPKCLMSFETNAGWEQKVKVHHVGTRFSDIHTGKGEGIIHNKRVVPEGVYEVSVWHRAPGGDWTPSKVVADFEKTGHVARANDGGSKDHTTTDDDEDFNDAVVRLEPMTE